MTMDMSVQALLSLARRAITFPQIDENDDPRIGAGRNDTDGGGTLTGQLIGAGSDEAQSASLKSLGSTFAPVLIYSAICFAIFFVFRRKCPRVYAPRTIPSLRSPEHPTPPLPDGWFDWIRPFFAIDDRYIINNCSVDGFFFLRFLRVLSVICLVGGCVSWPILLPIHSTGTFGQSQLDKLTIGNVIIANKFYAHVAVAWCFFGFVLFMVVRECVYYINVRQAYLLSPNYSKRLSSRTVLFTCIPKPYLEEAKLRKLFGDSARNIWIPRNIGALRAKISDREDSAELLEEAEIRLIRMANRSRRKFWKAQGGVSQGHTAGQTSLAKTLTPASFTTSGDSPSQKDAEKGGPLDSTIQFAEHQLSVLDSPTFDKPVDPEYTHPYGLDPSLPDVRGSVASLWIPAKDRPTHRPLRNFFRSVDTIRWTRARLKLINKDIWKLRRAYRGGDGEPLNSAFIEFDSQASAQVAFQILAHHQPLHMSPRYIGLQPDEVIWSSLRIRWWEHIMRRFFMKGVIAFAIIFWSIPSLLVGTISQIEFLSKEVFFLKWLVHLPSVILGVIQGLLPALALSWLMAAVPWMLRSCARVAGVPSHGLVELYVQNAYFFFQVVQVFLITTLSSAISAAFSQVLQEPFKAKDLLAANLPKASNFYLSYILVICLGAGSSRLLNLGDLILHQVIAKFTVKPRRQYHRWRRLNRVYWGAEFPRFTNLGVIALSYTCIAPLVLIFAGFGMMFVSYVYRYMIIFVFDSHHDTKGLFYPRALMHLLAGLYVAEICLIGLFALKVATGPMMLMLVFLIFTGLVHLSLSSALTPLLYNLPRTLALEKDTGEQIARDEIPDESTGGGGSQQQHQQPAGLASDYYNMDEDFGDDANLAPNHDLDTDVQLRGLEGSSSLKYMIQEFVTSAIKGKFGKNATTKESGLTRILTYIKIMITPDPNKTPNFIMTFFHPEVYQDFRKLQPTINPEPCDYELPEDYTHKAYWPPEMWQPAPKLWIPKDDARVSRQEVAHTKDSIFISDQGCWLNEKGRIECDFERSPLHEPRILY
ncbi:uncharacterized protein QC763_705000 [Podospora pseudopauciseta]|uniref:Uncharacterized protein n=1 Tax=Podospora pseudopauciseta TaxID=2093780 RepID=A0ABR0GZB8_9PEZI|nr:hypothetical protein QC763_705000 [Podospora pseudopauciseta]